MRRLIFCIIGLLVSQTILFSQINLKDFLPFRRSSEVEIYKFLMEKKLSPLISYRDNLNESDSESNQIISLTIKDLQIEYKSDFSSPDRKRYLALYLVKESKLYQSIRLELQIEYTRVYYVEDSEKRSFYSVYKNKDGRQIFLTESLITNIVEIDFIDCLRISGL